jgi:hypothetical protein
VPAKLTPGPDLERFLGRWASDRLSLDLENAAEGLKGRLTLQGKGFPAQAWVSGGRLEGSFRSGERKLPFAVEPQEDGSLLLTCDGRSYVLRRDSAESRPWTGHYSGSHESQLQLHTCTEQAWSGILTLERVSYELRGRAKGESVEGSLKDRLTGRSLGFSARHTAEGGAQKIVVTLRLEGEERRVSYQTLTFTRPAK